MAYDPQNVFARILRREIPCDPLYEDDHVLAFRDIRPQAKAHALIIPKGAYESAQDFSATAAPTEILAFVRAIPEVARRLGLGESGYRLIANTGADGHQEVPHFHLHILGGEPLGPMVNLPGK